MAKKGSVTVFFALILSLMVSLVCAGMESVRAAAARTQTLCGVDIGLYSLFGQYDRQLFKDYDLFFLDGSCGGGALKLARIYDELESYMEPVFQQNGQALRIRQGGFTGYRLATDENGEVFYHQVVRYMSDTLGSQGVQLLLDRMRDRQQQTREAEARGDQAENGGTLNEYNSEMDQAARNSEEAEARAREQAEQSGRESGGGDAFSDGQKKKVVNPITIIQRIRSRGILTLVLPYDKAVSEGSVDKKSLVSGRELQRGMSMPGSAEEDSTYASGVLFQKYLMDRLGNYSRPGKGGLKYQMEYILSGKDTDSANLKAAANKLLLIREGVNYACLLSDSAKRAQAASLALAIASTFLVPPASSIIEGALLLCWSFAESILDLRELFAGGKVPLVKSAADWQISLSRLPYLLEELDTLRKGSDSGMSYEDYLQILLLARGKREKLLRGMDMIEEAIRSGAGRSSFQLDSCIAAAEVSVDVTSSGGREFTATRQYCYD